MVRKGTVLSIALSALIVALTVTVNAQVIDGSFNPSAGLLPNSPEAGTLIKFIDVPVSPYTGTADVTIPITAIKEHKLQLPVSLSYHTGGHRVDDIANWVGLGWKLNAGGMVTRKVRGLPDDARVGLGFLEFRDQHTHDETVEWLQDHDVTQFQGLASGCWDAQPDEFYFEVNGLSGKFVFGWEKDEQLDAMTSMPKYVPGFPPIMDYPPRRMLSRENPDGYWDSGVLDAYRQGFDDNDQRFVRATDWNSSSGASRFKQGAAFAQRLIDSGELDKALSDGETIKIVGHSQGAAFAAGLATVLAGNEKYQALLEEVHYLAPHQPESFSHPASVLGVQFSTKSDLVSSSHTLGVAWDPITMKPRVVPNPIMWANGGSTFAQIEGVHLPMWRYSHNEGMRGHYNDTYLDEIARYFRLLGVNVTVYD